MEIEQKQQTGKGSRFYYGWVCVVLASLAMVATLPGRTIGLGVVTEPLIRDLGITRVDYGAINLWATLIGAAFGLGAGRLLDRWGSRLVLTLVSLLLGLTVLWMSQIHTSWELLVTVTLTRGLGQSALSAASVAVVGKWFERKVDAAMAVYAVLLSLGFAGAIPGLEAAVKQSGWRPAWWGMGLILAIGMAGLSWLFARDSPERAGLVVDGQKGEEEPGEQTGNTLREALLTPAFWAFALSGLLFNTAFSGIVLFNESILLQRGYTGSPSGPLAVVMVMGLVGNFGAGWIATRWRLTRLMAVAMLLLAGALALLPLVRTATAIMVYAGLMGLCAGIVTVVFFSCWSRAYGRRHLGKIQGAAQGITVLASAVGPSMLAFTEQVTGSYDAIFLACIPLALGLAAFCWSVRMPQPPTSASLREA